MNAKCLAYGNVCVKMTLLILELSCQPLALRVSLKGASPRAKGAGLALFFSCLDPASSYLESFSYLTFYRVCVGVGGCSLYYMFRLVLFFNRFFCTFDQLFLLK